jgi:hypothetical protein
MDNDEALAHHGLLRHGGGGRGGDYGLFSDAVNSPDYTASNGGIISQKRIKGGVEEVVLD